MVTEEEREEEMSRRILRMISVDHRNGGVILESAVLEEKKKLKTEMI